MNQDGSPTKRPDSTKCFHVLYILSRSSSDPSCASLRHVAAVVILLAWTEFILLVAKHPRLARYNVYISMFYKVLQTFLSFLLWYSLFLMAFAFGFYIMLHKVMLKEAKSLKDNKTC